MKELANLLLTSLVEHPKEVKITSVKKDNVLTLSVRLAHSDRGKVIGKQGKIIKALRAILSAAGLKQNIKVFLKVE